MKRFLKWLAISLAILILFAIGGIAWFGYSFTKSLEPKIDPRLYAGIVSERVRQSRKYALFPARIADDANKTAFFHMPGFLQGGDIIALRLQLPKEHLEEILTELKASGRIATREFYGIPEPNCYPKFGLTKPSRKNLFKDVENLPKDFQIFLFESDLANIRENWNHNFLAFTAISLQRSEVVYYAEAW